MAPWSFTTFNTSESTSTLPSGKPLQTLEQIIIRQLCREQRRRSRGQVCLAKLCRCQAVGEQRIAGPGLIKFLCVLGMAVLLLYKRRGDLSLAWHASLYLAAAAVLSPLPSYGTDALAGWVLRNPPGLYGSW